MENMFSSTPSHPRQHLPGNYVFHPEARLSNTPTAPSAPCSCLRRPKELGSFYWRFELMNDFLASTGPVLGKFVEQISRRRQTRKCSIGAVFLNPRLNKESRKQFCSVCRLELLNLQIAKKRMEIDVRRIFRRLDLDSALKSDDTSVGNSALERTT